VFERVIPAARFEVDGSGFVRGVETVHLVSAAPQVVEFGLVPYDGIGDVADLTVESLEVWVDSNGVTLKVEADFAGDDGADFAGEDYWSSYSIEFYDIGEPITVDVPRDVVEVDSQG
jgi:hypothetical protein